MTRLTGGSPPGCPLTRSHSRKETFLKVPTNRHGQPMKEEAATANIAVVPKFVFRHRKPSYIQVALCANDRPLSGLGKSV